MEEGKDDDEVEEDGLDGGRGNIPADVGDMVLWSLSTLFR